MVCFMTVGSSDFQYAHHIPHHAQAERASTPPPAQELTTVSKNLEKEKQIGLILNEHLSYKPDITMREVVEYALVTTQTLSKTEHILDKLLDDFGAYEGLTNEPAIMAKELFPASIELLAQGFESVDFLSKSAAYYEKEQEIHQKTEELKKLKEERKVLVQDSPAHEELGKKITSLKKEIHTLKEARADFVQETVKFVTSSAISTTKASSEIGLSIAQVGSHAAHALHIVGPVASLGGAVAVGVTSSIGLAENLKVTDAIHTKAKELSLLRDTLEEGSLLRDVVEWKLHQLQQQDTDVAASTLRNFTGCVTSLLGTTASVGAIVGATGVSLGAIGGGVVAGTGIGAIVIGTAVAIGGAAYAIHTNRERIAHGIEEAKIAIETPIQTLKYQQMKSTMEEIHTIREQEQAFLKETEKRKQKIDRYIKPIIEEINSNSIKKAELQKDIFSLKQAKNSSILDQIQAPLQIYMLEKEMEQLDQTISERKNHVTSILNEEEKQQKLSTKKIHDTTTRLYEVLEGVQATKDRIFVLKDEDKRIKEESRYVGWAKNIGDMNWTEARALHANFKERLQSGSADKTAVYAFLQGQNHDVAQFDSDPATVVLEYLTKEVVV